MTAVEWLEIEFVKLEHSTGVHHKMYELIEQAKEMEKQEQGYSKEDVLKFSEWFAFELTRYGYPTEENIIKALKEIKRNNMKELKQECECTDECLGYLTKECKRIEEPKQETLEEAPKEKLDFYQQGFVDGIKIQQEQLCNSEIIQRIKATKSDAEARRIIKSIWI
jgi:hypothetical protein